MANLITAGSSMSNMQKSYSSWSYGQGDARMT